MTTRQSQSWIEDFIEAHKDKPSPEIFIKWSAIVALAGALERRVWLEFFGQPLHANMYVLLTSPPGIGKSVIIREVTQLWKDVKEFNVAPSSVTKASLVDYLKGKSRNFIINSGTMLDYNTTLIGSSEFGVLVPSHDLDFLNFLNQCYDCELYEETRRTIKEPIKIPRPQLCIIGGTQPAYLAQLFPDTAWGMGFMSRILLVYSSAGRKQELFKETTELDNAETAKIMKIKNRLSHDMELISNLFGKFRADIEAKELLNSLHMLGIEPIPKHPRLLNYNARRTTHLLKLSMVRSVSRSNELIITKADVEWSRDTLLEMEESMTDAFQEMLASPDAQIITELHQWLVGNYLKSSKTPVNEDKVMRFLAEKVSATRIRYVLDAYERAGFVEIVYPIATLKAYKPLVETTGAI